MSIISNEAMHVKSVQAVKCIPWHRATEAERTLLNAAVDAVIENEGGAIVAKYLGRVLHILFLESDSACKAEMSTASAKLDELFVFIVANMTIANVKSLKGMPKNTIVFGLDQWRVFATGNTTYMRPHIPLTKAQTRALDAKRRRRMTDDRGQTTIETTTVGSGLPGILQQDPMHKWNLGKFLLHYGDFGGVWQVDHGGTVAYRDSRPKHRKPKVKK